MTAITLDSTQARSLSITPCIGADAEGELGFIAKPEFHDADASRFDIVFELAMPFNDGERQEDFVLKVEFWATFRTDEDMTEEFKNSHFIYVNAPAIAYPYLRALISNVLLQSGYDPLMLPAVNFAAMHKKEQEALSSE